jgi:hypothetical protein
MATRTSVATDDFNRASLGADWQQLNAFLGNINIYNSVNFSSSASGAPGTAAAARWVGAGTFTDDQYASAVISNLAFISTDYSIGVIARASADGNSDYTTRDYYYAVVCLNGDTSYSTRLGKVVNGTVTALYTANIAWTVGDRIEIECEGTTIRALKNGTLINSSFEVTDSALATGAPGVTCAASAGEGRGDDWIGGNLGGATSIVPQAMANYRMRAA